MRWEGGVDEDDFGVEYLSSMWLMAEWVGGPDRNNCLDPYQGKVKFF